MSNPIPAENEEKVQIASIARFFWTAVYTKPRCEKVLLEYAQRYSFNCYLPLLRKVQRYQRRNVVSYVPMFSSYVFVQLDEEGNVLSQLRKSDKLIRYLPITADQEKELVRELNSLQVLEKMQMHNQQLNLRPEIVVGKTVLVKSGPLAGVEGVVERRGARMTVAVNVELLGQAVSVEVDLGDLELKS